jgi:MYXO-CTERM domain-containing protein
MRPSGASLVLAAGIALLPHAARANGAFPESQALLLPADRPLEIVLATNFGLIISEDGGGSWQWTCERRETSMGALYGLGPVPDDRLFSLSPDVGLAVSSDGSCSWRRSGGSLANLLASDYFPDPTDPTRVLAIAAPPADAGAGPPAVYASSDGGETFDPVPLYTAPDGASLTGVEVARSDPRVVTLAALLPGAHPALVRSTDGGASWTTIDVEAALGPNPFRIVAVDPLDPYVVVLRVLAPGGDALAITHDGGATFVTPVTVPGGVLSAYVQLPSGTWLVAGLVRSVTDGGIVTTGFAWRSQDGGFTFQAWTLAPQPRLLALAEQGGKLYLAGMNYADGWAVAVSTDEGETIQPLATYDRVSAIKACVMDACQASCDNQAGVKIWAPEICTATPADGSTDAAPRPGDAGGCGCRQTPDGEASLAALAGMLLLLALASWRRAPRSPRAGLPVVVALVAVASSGLGACPTAPVTPPVCPDDVPAGCPTPAPGFAADAAPIIASHCAKCHTPGGMSQQFPFQTYDQIAPYAGDINLQLQICAMPPPPEPALTAAERQALFGWILCGALND